MIRKFSCEKMVAIRDKNYTKKIGEESIETIPFGVGAKNFHSGKFLIMPMLLVWNHSLRITVVLRPTE